MELVTEYRPDVLWSDGDTLQFLSWLYSDYPVRETVVTNDRWGVGVHCRHGVLQEHNWKNAMTIVCPLTSHSPLRHILL